MKHPAAIIGALLFLLQGGSAALDLHEDGGEDKIRRRPDVSGRASEVKASESIDRVHSMVRDISSQLINKKEPEKSKRHPKDPPPPADSKLPQKWRRRQHGIPDCRRRGRVAPR